MDAELREHALEVARPAVRDGRRSDRVLEDQIPADDPGEQLAERRVGVGVGRSGHRHHRRELRVAQRGEDAGHAGHDVREHQRRSGDVARGGAGRDEDAGADDRADAQAGQLDGTEHAAQPVLAGHLVEQLAERLRGEQLMSHQNSPRIIPCSSGAAGRDTRARALRGSPVVSRSVMTATASAPARDDVGGAVEGDAADRHEAARRTARQHGRARQRRRRVPDALETDGRVAGVLRARCRTPDRRRRRSPAARPRRRSARSVCVENPTTASGPTIARRPRATDRPGRRARRRRRRAAPRRRDR